MHNIIDKTDNKGAVLLETSFASERVQAKEKFGSRYLKHTSYSCPRNSHEHPIQDQLRLRRTRRNSVPAYLVHRAVFIVYAPETDPTALMTSRDVTRDHFNTFKYDMIVA